MSDHGTYSDPGSDSVAVMPVDIDLGFMDRARAVELDPPTSNPRPSPWLAVLLVLAFCSAGLTSAAQPAGQPRLMFATDGVIDAVRLVDGTMYTHTDTGDGSMITAYALETGKTRWQHRMTRRPAMLPAGPVLLLTPTSCRSADSFVTEALDAATGELRWRQRGTPVWTVADTSIGVFKRPTAGCTEATIGFDPSPSTQFSWVGIDLRTGFERWSIPVSANATLSAGTDGGSRARWLAVREGSMLTMYDLVTGNIAATMALPPDPPWPATLRMIGAGGQLLLVRRDRTTLNVTAYAAPWLAEQWQAAVAARRGASRLELDSASARWCGLTLCIGASTETVGIDSASGSERWRLAGRPLRTGERYLLFVRQPLAPGPPELTVYAAETGQETAALTGTEIVGRADGGVLLTMAGTEGGRLWRVDLHTGIVREITTLRRRYADCDAADRYLACRTPEGFLDVWRLPLACAAVACGAVPDAGQRRLGWRRQ